MRCSFFFFYPLCAYIRLGVFTRREVAHTHIKETLKNSEGVYWCTLGGVSSFFPSPFFFLPFDGSEIFTLLFEREIFFCFFFFGRGRVREQKV